jgi:hypothetical protein
MALPLPPYLTAATPRDNRLRYEWDDWRTIPAKNAVDETLVKRFSSVSHRAVLAFACGTAEWILQRLDRFCDDKQPWNYVEAAWARIVDIRYVGYAGGCTWAEYAMRGWEGPVKGPIDEGLRLLESAFQQLAWEQTTPTVYAAPLAALATYVLPDTAPYTDWCNRVLNRFEVLYPRAVEDALGDVVPRQAIDPAFDFRVEQTEALVNEFLSRLDYRANIFLSSPEGMLEPDDEGRQFRGVPYVFDIAADRRARQEAWDSLEEVEEYEVREDGDEGDDEG